jgi:hypothetical protein
MHTHAITFTEFLGGVRIPAILVLGANTFALRALGISSSENLLDFCHGVDEGTDLYSGGVTPTRWSEARQGEVT